MVVLETPQPFLAVGEWYRDFDQTTDEQVVSALARSAGTRAAHLELVVAGLFVLGGLHAVWYWGRRPFEGTDVADHLLRGLTSLVGIRAVVRLRGVLPTYASIPVQGRAALDDLEAYRWYLMVPLVLAAMQLLGGWFLGRRSPADET